jgi:hypothetical protein
LITFDINNPIETSEWVNVLDNTKPSSRVLTLPRIQTSPSFAVEWAGADEGAGIRDYTIFVSENGGPFVPWLVNTVEVSGAFTGGHGKHYMFYSVSRDQAGNVEEAPPMADAATHIAANHTINSGIEIDANGNRVPDGWKSATSGNDRRVCGRLKAYSGRCAFRFKGDARPGADVLKQVIAHEGAAGDTVDVRLFARATNLAPGKATAVLLVRNTATGQTETTSLPLPAGTYVYTEVGLAHVVGSVNPSLLAYDQVVVIIKMRGPAGSKVLIDDVRVFLSPP